MGKVRWTSEAERWLREIHDYIARDSPAAAARTVQRIYEKGALLADFPEITSIVRSRTGRSVSSSTATTGSPMS